MTQRGEVWDVQLDPVVRIEQFALIAESGEPLHESSMPWPRVVVVRPIDGNRGWLLDGYTADGRSAGDNWHFTREEAIEAARGRYERLIGPWLSVPEAEDDPVAYALQHVRKVQAPGQRNLNRLAETIETRADFVRFVETLAASFKTEPERWANDDLPSYLDAVASWTSDVEGWCWQTGEPVPERPSWQWFGRILLAATVYE